MAGLCEGGNEPPGSLKVICKMSSEISYTSGMQADSPPHCNLPFIHAVLDQFRQEVFTECTHFNAVWPLKEVSDALEVIRIMNMFYEAREGSSEIATEIVNIEQSLMLADSEFQSLGRAIVKEDGVRGHGMGWCCFVARTCVQIMVGRKISEARRQVQGNGGVQDFKLKEK
ncbi:hypothetical protein ANN_02043 [Periplaneta americana]|uniref:Uncharacterized protein n=1 Tax=Periplaneta americana TaxID=6978 RepID=A0ABQ8TXM4_PERAM|nr:hypothetical protein ANN_02043 [Periplaneta americana]